MSWYKKISPEGHIISYKIIEGAGSFTAMQYNKIVVSKDETEVTNLYEHLTNPSTWDKAFELAFAGVAGIIVLLIVKAKRKKHSTRKSNILY